MDPLHKWIGTYNSRLRNILRFFKWLYSPTLAHNQRVKSKLLLNVSHAQERNLYLQTNRFMNPRRRHSIFEMMS